MCSHAPSIDEDELLEVEHHVGEVGPAAHIVVAIRGFDIQLQGLMTEKRGRAGCFGFVRLLVENSRPLREICVGHEWSFGKNRAGNLTLLQTLGAQLDFDVVGIKPVTVNGTVVSSTAIRSAVESGDLARAAEMLGRDYTILGTVERGAQLGRMLGFPTANLSAHSEQFPPNGVYAAEARVNGETFRGVANLVHRDDRRML